jgi:hypothetical protein
MKTGKKGGRCDKPKAAVRAKPSRASAAQCAARDGAQVTHLSQEQIQSGEFAGYDRVTIIQTSYVEEHHARGGAAVQLAHAETQTPSPASADAGIQTDSRGGAAASAPRHASTQSGGPAPTARDAQVQWRWPTADAQTGMDAVAAADSCSQTPPLPPPPAVEEDPMILLLQSFPGATVRPAASIALRGRQWPGHCSALTGCAVLLTGSTAGPALHSPLARTLG